LTGKSTGLCSDGVPTSAISKADNVPFRALVMLSRNFPPRFDSVLIDAVSLGRHALEPCRRSRADGVMIAFAVVGRYAALESAPA